MDYKIDLPKDVEFILNELNKYGKSVICGGFIRDSLLNLNPKDVDFATELDYKKIINIFKEYQPKLIGEAFNVVQIKLNNIHYEIAQYRKETNHTGNRNEFDINFNCTLEEDVKRRDYTICSLTYDGKNIIDYNEGLKDLKNKLIRFVGNPKERIFEDKLRMLRGVRFASKLNFEIEEDTFKAIKTHAHKIKEIPTERIQMELNKILLQNSPSKGIKLLQQTQLLKYIIPELEDCVNFNQNNSHHNKDLMEHLLETVKNTKPILVNRLSALLHDIGKVQTHSIDEKGESHYYVHHKVSANMSEIILKRLKYDNKTIEVVKRLIYDHMNKSDKQSDKAVKKFILRVGEENLENMFDLLYADVMAHKPPHNLKSLEALKQRCYDMLNREEPIKKSQLNINGNDLMKLGYKQGKIMGKILDECMEFILDNPEMNKKELLLEYVEKINLYNPESM